ncbi:pseudouridylate synthase 7 homolog [Neodiprion lecontei]|uniref:Pseudouridylate synthase 7 homolog n=1 Tax=Neodiprion lecontei TaxID=441921 RepID=A0A6J0BE62_NEOLC|nr:pseudouridylate synthase 7 homolog [Neodiprion lecontei]
MQRSGDGKQAGTGSSDGRGQTGHRGHTDRYFHGGGRSFSRGGYYGGGGDGWGHRGGGGYRGYRGRSRGYRGGNQNRRGYKRNQGNLDIDGKRLKMEVGNRLKEVDIGVTEFVGNHNGFSGVVKERYGDFHVHEITLNGEIAKLTNQTIPPEPDQLENMEDLKKEIPPEVWKQLETLIEADSVVLSVEINVTTMNKDERRAIHAIAKKIPNTISQTMEKGETKFIVVAKANKQKQSGRMFRRDQRVDWARRGGNYCQFLLHKVNIDTMDALNQMGMYLRLKSNMFNYAGTKDRRARTTQWVSLKKINPLDILAAAKSVRGAYVGNFKFCDEPLKLGMLSGNRFSIALRSVTGSDEEIDKAMTSLRDNGFINYYGLQRFGTVAAIPTHEIGKALLQGKWHEAIELILKPRAGELQRDLVEAREIYQKSKDAHAAFKRISRPDKIEAKLLWGLHVCGDKNPQGALDWIPRNTSLMYIHAYQSFIWNLMVSRRIKELGPKPVVGDLVYENRNFNEETDRLDFSHHHNEDESENDKKQNPATDKNRANKSDLTEVGKPEEAAENKEGHKVEDTQIEGKDAMKIEIDEVNMELAPAIDNENNEDAAKDTDNGQERERKREAVENKEENKVEDPEIEAKDSTKIEVDEVNMEIVPAVDNENNLGVAKDTEKVEEVKNDLNQDKNTAEVDKEDLRSLPAVKILTEEDLSDYTLADIVMPQPGWRVTYPTYAKPWFDEILAKDGLTTDLRQKNRKYTLGGAYRKMLEIPSDISWRIMRYQERYDDLILCDIDEMRGLPAPKENPEGRYKALIVEMSLRPSTYATMALREILKCDTSSQTQAAQSAANKAEEDEREKKESTNEDEQKSPDVEVKEDKEAIDEDNGTKMEVVMDTEPKEEKMDVADDKENDDDKDTKTLTMETDCIENTVNIDVDTVITKP